MNGLAVYTIIFRQTFFFRLKTIDFKYSFECFEFYFISCVMSSFNKGSNNNYLFYSEYPSKSSRPRKGTKKLPPHPQRATKKLLPQRPGGH